DTGEIVASELITEHVGDETALPGLLSKADADVARFLADGAYDGQGVYDCLAAKYGADIALIVPPPKKCCARRQSSARQAYWLHWRAWQNEVAN
ncbi:MAG: hypothetical protein ABJO34_12470, partial [Sedimentitalea sp.]